MVCTYGNFSLVDQDEFKKHNWLLVKRNTA